MGKSIDNSLGDTEHKDSSVLGPNNFKPGFFAEVKHYMNPLHIYCKERKMKIPKGVAKFLARDIYERVIYNTIFNNHKKNVLNF